MKYKIFMGLMLVCVTASMVGCEKSKDRFEDQSDIRISAGDEETDSKAKRNIKMEDANSTQQKKDEADLTAVYIATKEDESMKALHGVGTLGFISGSEVKIEMSEGAYQTFVIKKSLKKKIKKMKQGMKVSFQYKYLEGSAAMQIVSISKKS